MKNGLKTELLDFLNDKDMDELNLKGSGYTPEIIINMFEMELGYYTDDVTINEDGELWYTLKNDDEDSEIDNVTVFADVWDFRFKIFKERR